MRYIIYKITNNINGKIYIGKHKCKHLDDGYFGSGFALQNAVEKYGKENFTLHLEFELQNQEEMDLLERYVVTKEFVKLDTNYNMSVGGPNCILYGENNGFFSRHHSEETKRKISEMRKNFRQTEENKRRISETLRKRYREHPELRGSYNQNRGKVLCENKNGTKKYFFNNKIPEGYKRIELKKNIRHHVSEEKKMLNKIRQSEHNKNCRWYNNGKVEKYCLVNEVPKGFVLGRLYGINIGRKYSKETLRKMSISAKKRGANNKGAISITNGIENRYITKDIQIPEGWNAE